MIEEFLDKRAAKDTLMRTIAYRIRAGILDTLARSFYLAVVVLSMSGLAAAQGDAQGTTPPYLKPGLPAGSYPLSGFESVNLFNGNLNFHLPLLEVAGRGGARIPIMKKIEARWRVETDNCAPPCGPIVFPSYNWWTAFPNDYGPGFMQGRASTFGNKYCAGGEEIPDKSLIRLTFTAPDGTEYELRDKLTDGAPQPIPDYPTCPNYPWFNRGSVFVTSDGSSATFISCQANGTLIPIHDSDALLLSGVLLLRDGSRYRIDGCLVSWMQDRNGNRITFSYDSNNRVTLIVDSLNRQITIAYNVAAGSPYGTCDEISFKGFGGVNTKTIRVSKALMSTALRSGFSTHTYHYLFPNFNCSCTTTFDTEVTTAVWLPDLTRAYKFYYNDYGELARMVLPTGGAIEYDWAEGMVSAPTGGSNAHGGIYRRVVQRRTYPNGASGNSFTSKQTFTVPETYAIGGAPPNDGYVLVQEFDSGNNPLTYSKHFFNGSAVYNPNEDNNGVGFYYPWNSGKEYKTEERDTNGQTILRQVEHTFDPQTAPNWWLPPYTCSGCIAPPTNPRITQTLTSWVQAFPTTFKTPVPDSTGQQGSNARLQTIVDYDLASGLVKSITDPNGQVTTASYDNDPLDRLKAITRPTGGGQTFYTYGDTVGSLYVRSQTTQDANQTLDSYQYFDGFGRATIASQAEASESIYVETQYDALGRVYKTSNPYRSADIQRWTTNQYDALSRVVTVTQSGGAITSTSYSGNSVTITDPATKSRKTVSDALGRMTSVIEDPGGTGHLNYQTSYTYDALDNLRKVVQGGQTRYFGYDSLKRLLRVKNPEQDINTNIVGTDPVTSNTQWCAAYTYDNNSNLSTRVDPRSITTTSITTTYAYDAINRVKTRSYSNDPNNTPAVAYKYDGLGVTAPQNALGKLTSVATSGTFVSSYTYDNFDAMGRVLHSTQTTDGTVYGMGYGYDLAGHLISETYPSGRMVLTAYDTAGRTSDVSSALTHYESSFTYAAHGGVSDVKLGNDLWEHTTFEPNRLQPTDIYLGTSQGAYDKLKLSYGYGSLATNNGNVMSQTITAPKAGGGNLVLTQTYTYDSLNRLLSANENGSPSWVQNYDYDRYGNRAVNPNSTLIPNPALTPTSLNNFSTATNRITLNGFDYDGAGNMKNDPTTITNPPNGMLYDGENRQISYTKAGAVTSYAYDGDGHRVKKIAGSVTTLFVYNASGKLTAEYTNDTTPPAGGGGTSYLTSDHLDSTRVVTDSSGAVKARYDYLPFGEEIPSTIGSRGGVTGYGGADSTKQKFTQKERDSESGLDSFGARYYGSAQGRFTSIDPLLESGVPRDPQSWHRYAYAFNNPLRYIDPTGMENEPADNGEAEEKKKRRVITFELAGGVQILGKVVNIYVATGQTKEYTERVLKNVFDAAKIINDAAAAGKLTAEDQKLIGNITAIGAPGEKASSSDTFRVQGVPGISPSQTFGDGVQVQSGAFINSQLTLGSFGSMLASQFGHEGKHVEDYLTKQGEWGPNPPKSPEARSDLTERRADRYQLGLYVRLTGMDPNRPDSNYLHIKRDLDAAHPHRRNGLKQ